MHSPDHSTKGTPSGGHVTQPSDGWRGHGFRVSFIPLGGVLFTIPSRYLVHYRSFRVPSLGGWSPQLPTGFRVSRGTQAHSAAVGDRLQDWHLLRCVVRTLRLSPPRIGLMLGLQPHCELPRTGLGCYRVRSPLLAVSRLISCPRGTEMFQFPRLPSARLWIQQGIPGHAARWVAPFGLVRFIACTPLPGHVSARAPSFLGPERLGIHHVPFRASSLVKEFGKIEIMDYLAYWQTRLRQYAVLPNCRILCTCSSSVLATRDVSVFSDFLSMTYGLRNVKAPGPLFSLSSPNSFAP
jgi:hypothetical protein